MKATENETEKVKRNCLQLLQKSIMNSLYGKFGMDFTGVAVDEPVSNEALICQLAREGYLSDIRRIDENFFNIQGVTSQSNSRSNVMIAAYVTAWGRILLRKIQRDISALGFDLLYSDTDSVYAGIPASMDNYE